MDDELKRSLILLAIVLLLVITLIYWIYNIIKTIIYAIKGGDNAISNIIVAFVFGPFSYFIFKFVDFKKLQTTTTIACKKCIREQSHLNINCIQCGELLNQEGQVINTL